MKNKKKLFIVGCDTYNVDILVAIGTATDEVIRFCERKLSRKLSEEERQAIEMPGEGRTCRLATRQIVLRLKNYPASPFTQGILAHEIYHVTEFLFEAIGMGMNTETSEAAAYFIGSTTEKILKRLT